jgi:tetratricopeptide (TPR) repeat protein
MMLGQCFAKTGRPDLQKAAESRALPLMMGLDQAWVSMLDWLQNQRLPAYRQWLETAYRVATPGSPFASQIRYRLAFAMAEEGKLQEALKLWPGCVLSAEGVKLNSVSDLSWLRAQYHALRARAFIAEKKYEEAIQAVRFSIAHRPYSPVGIDIVRQLEKEGRGTDADVVFDLYYQSRLRACTEYPGSSSYQNDLSWLCVNTHRNLEEAQTRAERANALFTRRPELMDTLAEVYFQRGNKTKAEDILRLCTWMQPATEYFRLQQKRIQEDRKSEHPPEPSWMTELTGE